MNYKRVAYVVQVKTIERELLEEIKLAVTRNSPTQKHPIDKKPILNFKEIAHLNIALRPEVQNEPLLRHKS